MILLYYSYYDNISVKNKMPIYKQRMMLVGSRTSTWDGGGGTKLISLSAAAPIGSVR
jgi:hypothetical protein